MVCLKNKTAMFWFQNSQPKVHLVISGFLAFSVKTSEIIFFKTAVITNTLMFCKVGLLVSHKNCMRECFISWKSLLTYIVHYNNTLLSVVATRNFRSFKKNLIYFVRLSNYKNIWCKLNWCILNCFNNFLTHRFINLIWKLRRRSIEEAKVRFGLQRHWKKYENWYITS